MDTVLTTADLTLPAGDGVRAVVLEGFITFGRVLLEHEAGNPHCGARPSPQKITEQGGIARASSFIS